MSEIKDEKQKDISTEYVMKFFHEDAMMSGFLHVKIQRIRNHNESLENREHETGQGQP